MSDVKKVQIRGGFSDRNKIQPLNTEIQLHDLDERTRHALANLVWNWFIDPYSPVNDNDFFLSLARDVFYDCIDDNLLRNIKYAKDEVFTSYIREPFCKDQYDEVLSLCEYVVNLFIRSFNQQKQDGFHYGSREDKNYIEQINNLFKKEFVGYRFLGEFIIPISDDIEVNSINEALSINYEGPRNHINNALALFSNREKPDYKNTIKESISAVESICQIITGDDKATLGKALNKLQENGLNLHPARRKAFSELYGYTSDQGGIRHAEGMFASEVSFEEAKYMLVSCCAFVNFLIAEEVKK